jgi:hypothetical protein
MLVQLNTLGDCYEEAMERIYEAASVHGNLTDEQFDDLFISDEEYAEESGLIMTIRISCDHDKYMFTESVLRKMLPDLDMTYNIEILA